MPINRVLLKLEAKNRIMRSKPNAIMMGMIVTALFLVMEMLIPGVLGLNKLPFEIPENITTYDAYVAAMEQLEAKMYAFLQSYRPSVIAVVLAFALMLMREMVNIGLTIYSLHIAREEKADFGNLMDGFAIFGRVIVLMILQSVIVGALLLVFIVPGAIMSYRYRQAMFLLIEHPEYSPMQCLRESGKLMRGRKAELLMLDLSFFGWYLAEALLPMIGSLLAVWVMPYTRITYAGYYCHVAGPRTSPDGKNYIDAEFTDIPDA